MSTWKYETDHAAQIAFRDFSYDAATGILLRKSADKAWHKWLVGKPLGSRVKTAAKYLTVCIDSHCYKVHRVCWLLYWGNWPTQFIDHIDGNGLNNKIENLRDVSRSQNGSNCRKQRSKSGLTGVAWDSLKKKWIAKIVVDGRQIYIGLFTLKRDACLARKKAEKKHGFYADGKQRAK
jgi:hypothetical protein